MQLRFAILFLAVAGTLFGCGDDTPTSTARTSSSTLRIGVTDLGAIGDGISDDSAPIQVALDSVREGQTVYFPQGVYLTTETLVVRTSRISLLGDEGASIIRATDSSFNLFAVRADRVAFFALAFEGAALNDDSRQFAIFTDEEEASASRGRVEQCKFSGATSAVGLNGGIKLDTDCDRWVIARNTFERLVGASAGTGYGVLVGASSGHSIQDNSFSGSPGRGRRAVYLSAGASYNHVFNNKINSMNQAAVSIASYSHQPPCLANVVVANGIRNQGALTSGTAAIEIYGNAAFNVVHGNAIFFAETNGIILEEGAQGQLNRSNVISSNHIYRTGEVGILVNGAIETQLTRNSIDDASTKRPSTWSAIALSSGAGGMASDRTYVSSNFIGEPGCPVHYDVAIVVKAATNTRVLENRIRKGSAGAVEVSSGALSSTIVSLNTQFAVCLEGREE